MTEKIEKQMQIIPIILVCASKTLHILKNMNNHINHELSIDIEYNLMNDFTYIQGAADDCQNWYCFLLKTLLIF